MSLSFSSAKARYPDFYENTHIVIWIHVYKIIVPIKHPLFKSRYVLGCAGLQLEPQNFVSWLADCCGTIPMV